MSKLILTSLKDHINTNFSTWANVVNTNFASTGYSIKESTPAYVNAAVQLNQLPMILIHINSITPKFVNKFDYDVEVSISAFVYNRNEETVSVQAEMYARALIYGLYEVPISKQTDIGGIMWVLRSADYLGSTGVNIQEGKKVIKGHIAGIEVKLQGYYNSMRP